MAGKVRDVRQSPKRQHKLLLILLWMFQVQGKWWLITGSRWPNLVQFYHRKNELKGAFDPGLYVEKWSALHCLQMDVFDGFISAFRGDDLRRPYSHSNFFLCDWRFSANSALLWNPWNPCKQPKWFNLQKCSSKWPKVAKNGPNWQKKNSQREQKLLICGKTAKKKKRSRVLYKWIPVGIGGKCTFGNTSSTRCTMRCMRCRTWCPRAAWEHTQGVMWTRNATPCPWLFWPTHICR